MPVVTSVRHLSRRCHLTSEAALGRSGAGPPAAAVLRGRLGRFGANVSEDGLATAAVRAVYSLEKIETTRFTVAVLVLLITPIKH